MAVQEIFLIFPVFLQTLHALCVQLLFIKLDYLLKRPKFIINLHVLFVRDVLLMHYLCRSYSLPYRLKLSLCNSRRLNELHIIDVYLLSYQVRLLQPCMTVEVNVPVNHSKLTARKSQLSP